MILCLNIEGDVSWLEDRDRTVVGSICRDCICDQEQFSWTRQTVAGRQEGWASSFGEALNKITQENGGQN